MKVRKRDLFNCVGVILIVDDDPFVLASLGAFLEREGYRVITAARGEEAVKIIKKEPVAIIISDYNMPGMNGIEVMREAIRIRPDAIRVLLAGGDDLKIAVSAINVGQVYQYIAKPWDEDELGQIIKSSFDKYRLISENRVLQEMILTQNKKLRLVSKSLQDELRIGSRIHEKLLIGDIPRDIPGVVVDTLSLASKEIDGDFFEFYRQSNAVFDLVIGDVMGKGLAAALVGTAVKTQIKYFACPFPRAFSFNRKLKWQALSFSPSEILSCALDATYGKLKDLEYFVSLFYARFDLAARVLSFIDCGSVKPLHFRAEENRLYELDGDNYPLGVIERDNFEEKRVSFSAGDFFVFYSDGVTEAKAANGELFGRKRLLSVIESNSRKSVGDILEAVEDSVNEFTGKGKPDDDLTIVIIKIIYALDEGKKRALYRQFNFDMEELEKVRLFIRRLCQGARGDKKRLSYEMQLLVNEVFTNIVGHGCEEGIVSPVQMVGELRGDGLFLKISDMGRGYNPCEVSDPCSLGERDNGYGCYIINEIADTLTYVPKGSPSGWNHLSIFKKYHLGEQRMKLDYQKRGKVLLIVINEEYLDANSAAEFKEKAADIIRDQGVRDVVLDLSDLKFIDSSGLGSFLSLLRSMNAKNGDLKLARMSKSIRSLFEMVRMHKIFEIFNTREEAIRSFK